MRVIEPARYQAPPKHRRRPSFIVVLLVLLVVVGTVNYLRPLPTPVATMNVPLPGKTAEPVISWPTGGQAAIAAEGYGVLGTNGSLTPLATASIAKVIVALCVLQKQPLQPGQSGPTYTIQDSDVDLYQMYAAEDGSLVPVSKGERLTEYQALQALLLPSANNIADSLVRWVFGGQTAYASYAASFLQQHGLDQTHIGGDASGFDPGTVSTASDLANLGLLALKNPALMSIVGQHSAVLPVAGTIQTTDTALGVNGITGLKTGNNDADPGAFLFTATARIGDKDLLLTGSVMGAPDLATALQDSTQLVASEQQGFEQVTIARSGQQVGTLRAAWGDTVAITTGQALQVVRWKATPFTETHQLDTTVRAGTIGDLKVSAGQAKSTTPLQLGQSLPGPSFWWRLTRH